MCNTIRTEQAASYEAGTHPLIPPSQGDVVIQHALTILRSRLATPGEALTSPDLVRNFLTLQLAQLEEEHFALLLLNNQHQVIEYEIVARGTLDSATVYPREVVKMALRYNAAAVIMAHNHPSGNPEPSTADIQLTRRLKEALALIDVRVLDHIIIGGCSQTPTVSFAVRGLI